MSQGYLCSPGDAAPLPLAVWKGRWAVSTDWTAEEALVTRKILSAEDDKDWAKSEKQQNPQLHQHISPALFTPKDHCTLQQVWGLRPCISNQLSGQAAHAEPVVSSIIPLV